MLINKATLRKVSTRVALLLATGSLVLTGITPAANAAGASPLFLSFESDDLLKNDSISAKFGDPLVAITPSSNLSGDALQFTKASAGAAWSGTNLILATSTTLRFADAANSVITLDYFSNDSATSPVQLRLLAGGSTVTKVVDAAPGKSTLIFDMSTGQGWDPAKAYNGLVIYPNFSSDDNGYTGSGPVPNTDQVYEIDNVSIAGGTVANIFVPAPVVAREATSTLLTFETGDALGAAAAGPGFEGAVSVIKDAAAGGNGGKALEIEKAGQPWAGIVLATAPSNLKFLDATNKTVTMNYYSPQTVATPVQFQFEATDGSKINQAVEAAPGWSKLTIDFTDFYNDAKEYTIARLYPNFVNTAQEVPGYNGAPAVTPLTPVKFYFVDNVGFNGAETPAIPVAPAPREATSTVLTFESGDILGAAVVGGTTGQKPQGGFEGAATSISVAPAGGNGGNALKIVKGVGSATYAGANFIKFGADKRVTNGTHKTITLNYHSSKANSPVRIEVKGYPETAVFKTVIAPLGWSKLTFDFTDAPGWTSTEEFTLVAIFPDFDVAGAGDAFYVDNLAFNGATTPEIPAVSVPREATSTLLTFETGDALGAKVDGVATNAKPEGGFEGALTTIENAPAGGNGGKALKIVKNGAAYAGANFIKFGADKRVTNGTHKTITLNYHSSKANSPVRIEVKGYPETAVFKTVIAPLGWSKLTFDFTDAPGWTSTEEFVTVAIFPDFDVAATGAVFYVDNLAFNGATTPAIPLPKVKPTLKTAAAVGGTAKVARTLTAGKGSWTGTATITYTYKWYRCTVASTKTATTAPTSSAKCVAISGGTKSTYKLASADVGKYVRVLITAKNSAGTAYSLSKTTSKVVK